jgi:hypothetical protein
MKKLLITLFVLVLVGCASDTVPTIADMKWPDAPANFFVLCPDLAQISSTEKLSEVLPVIVSNYGTYYGCQSKVDNWVEWYNTQKKISDSLK